MADKIDPNRGFHGQRQDPTNWTGIPVQTEVGGKYPLSYQQRSLWFLQQLDPDDFSYNENKVLRLRGLLDRDQLDRAFRDLVLSHHILRTVYCTVNGEPLQYILSEPDAKIDVVTATGDDAISRITRAIAKIKSRAQHPFDLEKNLPIRADLHALAPDDHLLHVSVHHIATDGWSWPILLEGLLSNYAASTSEVRHTQGKQPGVQYADYSIWQQQVETDADFRPALDFWLSKLEGSADLDLPTDNIRQVAKSHRGRTHRFEIPPELVERYKILARAHRTTPFIVLLSAFKLLLARLSGKNDVVVGVPVSNRTEQQLEPLIGLFVNTIAVRSTLSKSDSFSSLVAHLRNGWLASLDHQKLPFDKLVTSLRPDRHASRNPIFQILFSYLRAPPLHTSVSDLSIKQMIIDFGASRFDVELSLQDTEDGIEGHLLYDSDLFEPATMARMASQYLLLLDAATTDPDCLIWDIPMLSAEERQTVLEAWNQTETPYSGHTVHEIFQLQARQTPSRSAIRHGETQMTYAELNALANRISARLRRMGITPETAVAVHLERSGEYIAACLGIMKAGGLFVPLDTTLPALRRAAILKDCAAKVMITNTPDFDLIVPPKLQRLDLQASAHSLLQEPPDDCPSRSDLENAAYVLYTSGSTGEPNGVVGTQRGLVNRLHWMHAEYPFEPNDVCVAKTRIGFIDSVTEILGPLIFGTPVVVANDLDVSDTRQFVKILAREGVTRIVLVPSLLRVMLETTPGVEEQLSRVRLWICSGEVLSPDLVRSFSHQLPGRKLINLYGSTEISGDATFAEMTEGRDVTIGRPIANTTCYILDARGQPVPVGIQGQLHVGGDGLAREYLGRPTLTQDRFTVADVGQKTKTRLFQTGDLARFLPDGRIEFLGRDNTQVKLRGIRIEIGEIETALRAIDRIVDAVVVPMPDAVTVDHLYGYVQTRTSDTGPNWHRRIRTELAKTLPSAFVPAQIIEVSDFPRTASGKIDRHACRAMKPATPDRDRDTDTDTVAEISRDSQVLESRMLDIWREFLGDQAIDPDADFFELGGHSLMAVRLVAQIEIVFGIRLPLSALFKAPTVRLLARRLLERSDRFGAFLMEPASACGEAPPLFCLHGLFYYRGLAKALKDIVPTYSILIDDVNLNEGATKSTPDHDSLEYLVERYIVQIRSVRPTGPYYLAGLSAGGIIAIEVARQLRASGQEVGLVALLDTNAPRAPVYILLGKMRRWLGAVVRGRPPEPWNSTITTIYNDAYRTFMKTQYEGNVIILRAAVSNFGVRAADLGWKHYITGRITVHVVPGDHLGMLHESNVLPLGRIIAAYCTEK